MTPTLVFFSGLFVLILFGWYVATDIPNRKRAIGTVLTLILLGFCLAAVWPHVNKVSGKKEFNIKKGLDLQGGTSYLLRLISPPDETTGEQRSITPAMVDQAVEVIRKRVDQFGVNEPIITPQGSDRILVQIAGVEGEKADEAREQLRKVARLDFKMVHPESDRIVAEREAGGGLIPPGFEILSMKEERNNKPVEEKLLVRKKTDLSGKLVSKAAAVIEPTGEFGISLEFNSEGAAQFAKLTKENVGNRFAIVLDGDVKSAPVIREAILGGRASITGRFGQAEALNLASVLNNPLDTPVEIEEERSASATLGEDSIKSGIYAGIGGLALVLVFVLIYYRFSGIVALVGLSANIILLFGAMSLFNFTLTLPGIAGIILIIGMAVDANVLIYERLREELAAGKNLAAAIEGAYNKAFTVIFDANVTTIITSAILFWLASGPVKGFAVTLTVGIIASVFCAMIVTRTTFGWCLGAGLKKVTMSNLIPANRQINFMGRRRLWAGISIGVILFGLVAFAIRGKDNFGVDFRGGDLLTLSYKNPVSESEARKALQEIQLGDVIIQKEKSVDTEFLSIRSPEGTSEKIESQLLQKFPDAGFAESKKDTVKALVGMELAKTSGLALGLGLLGILVYVTLRFEFSFALGAVIALLHDVVITLGVFALFGKEMSLVMVGAILTIAGYSINDTIVVYDRIREDLRAGHGGKIETIMNTAINQTLSRTLLTSGTTFLSVLALFFFGGPVLRDFSFAILIGIVAGTYSSIFIASPFVLWWSGRKGGSLKAEVQDAHAATA